MVRLAAEARAVRNFRIDAYRWKWVFFQTLAHPGRTETLSASSPVPWSRDSAGTTSDELVEWMVQDAYLGRSDR